MHLEQSFSIIYHYSRTKFFICNNSAIYCKINQIAISLKCTIQNPLYRYWRQKNAKLVPRVKDDALAKITKVQKKCKILHIVAGQQFSVQRSSAKNVQPLRGMQKLVSYFLRTTAKSKNFARNTFLFETLQNHVR